MHEFAKVRALVRTYAIFHKNRIEHDPSKKGEGDS